MSSRGRIKNRRDVINSFGRIGTAIRFNSRVKWLIKSSKSLKFLIRRRKIYLLLEHENRNPAVKRHVINLCLRIKPSPSPRVSPGLHTDKSFYGLKFGHE